MAYDNDTGGIRPGFVTVTFKEGADIDNKDFRKLLFDCGVTGIHDRVALLNKVIFRVEEGKEDEVQNNLRNVLGNFIVTTGVIKKLKTSLK